MTPAEFCRRIAALGYSQRGFAAYVGANERTIRRWAAGEQDIPQWVIVLLDLKAAPSREGAKPMAQRQHPRQMELHRVYKVTVPAGDYILGDPCYSVPDTRWDELLKSCDCFEGSPVGSLDGFDILAFGTQYGDGVYQGPNGSSLGVDSGMIGLVPAALPEIRSPDGLTIKITFDAPTVCERRDNGVLIFGKHRIRT